MSNILYNIYASAVVKLAEQTNISSITCIFSPQFERHYNAFHWAINHGCLLRNASFQNSTCLTGSDKLNFEN